MKFAIIWNPKDPYHPNIEYVDSLVKFSQSYKDEVKKVILKFEKEAKNGEFLYLHIFGDIYDPVIRRVE